jgi:hypothetical protein
MLFHFFRKNKADSTELNSLNLQTAHPHHLKTKMIKALPPIILATLFVGLAFYVKQETTQIKFIFQVTEERQANILSSLNEMQSPMENLKADHEQIMSLQTSLTHLQEVVAKENSLASLAKSAEMQQIARELQKLKPANRSADLLKKRHRKSKAIPMTLPFRVKSLDIIADQPYASVEYQQNTLPLRVNDQLAGWRAIDMNITDGKVVWEHLKTRRKITIAASRTLYE